MLQKDAAPVLNERHRHMLDEAEKSCARFIAIVGEISDLGKLDSSRVVAGNENFDLFSVLPDVASSVHEAADREVHLETRGALDGAPLTGDLTRLKQAFAAIFRAILREQPRSCTVVADWKRVSKEDDTRAVIVVAPQSSVQLTYGTSLTPFEYEKRGGLGLALPIALRVLEQFGGSVWAPVAEDGKPERGAAVVSIPLREHNR